MLKFNLKQILNSIRFYQMHKNIEYLSKTNYVKYSEYTIGSADFPYFK